MTSAANSRQGAGRSAAPAPQPPQPGMNGQPQGMQAQQPPNPQFPQQAGYPPGMAGMPPPGQPGGYPGMGYPGYFPPMGYPPYGYGMPPPAQPPPEQTRHDDRTRDQTQRQTQRERTRPSAVQEEEEPQEEDEDEDEDASTSYLDSDESSVPETVSSIDINDMYSKFRKFSNKEEDIDKKFGMRVQIREPQVSPYEKKSCTCVPRTTGGILPMIYESKKCICGYGTEKMIQDSRKPVHLLWSPVEEQFVDEYVKNFKRIVPEKVKFPTIPGTAPAPTELRPKAINRLRVLPGTSNGRPSEPMIPRKQRLIDSFGLPKARNKSKPPKPAELIPDEDFEPEFKESIIRKGKYYDAKLGAVVEYRMFDTNNTVVGKKKTV